MKHGKKLTRKEKEYFSSCGLNPVNWLRIKETVDYVEYINRISGKTRRLAK
ncbi:DUF6906 family protein [Filifactor villosus]|uniref:DUF6906 family protein n=1 Tax=Filifactor villosus TaxID=29374 RepID=A0ABV9QMZ0_9FIRM